MDYSKYQHILIERKDNGILLLTLNRPEVLNATNHQLHWELSQIWRDIGDDEETRVAVVTGAGRAFSAGGDITQMQTNPEGRTTALKRASDLVYNMVNLDKPIVSAINGVAVGAGLAVALLADVSIIAEDARLTDGHLRLGVPAGDHAVLLWPLLCGMAKAKYYLLTADFIDGREAERIGLVSLAVPREELMDRAMTVATKLATGPQFAVRWTKHALNNWLRSFGPHFDFSLALEMMGFMTPDAREGMQAFIERRPANFPSAED